MTKPNSDLKPGCRINRRTMLARTSRAGAMAAVAAWAGPLWAAPQSRGFKIGACEWCLGRFSPKCFDVAKEIGLDGVQVSMGSRGDKMHMTQGETRTAYLDAAKRTGLEIASLALTEMNAVPLKREPEAAQWLAQSIDICRALGCRVSMPACFGEGDLSMENTAEIDHLVKVIKDAAPAAEKAGIAIALENYLSAKDNMTIIDRIGSSAVKVYYDVGNSTDKGYDIYAEIRELGKRDLLAEFHFKDGGALLGKGRIDFAKVRRAMDDVNYRGWIQLESACPGGLVPDYRTQCEFVRGLFPRSVASDL